MHVQRRFTRITDIQGIMLDGHQSVKNVETAYSHLLVGNNVMMVIILLEMGVMDYVKLKEDGCVLGMHVLRFMEMGWLWVVSSVMIRTFSMGMDVIIRVWLNHCGSVCTVKIGRYVHCSVGMGSRNYRRIVMIMIRMEMMDVSTVKSHQAGSARKGLIYLKAFAWQSVEMVPSSHKQSNVMTETIL